MEKNKIALFASGTGSNAQQLIHYFRNHALVTVSLIVCNKPGAGVTQIAEREGVELMLIDKNKLQSPDFPKVLLEKGTDYIILAGFLLKIPESLIQAFPRHIINIHPALLPKYGGKGMYGDHVHKAVLAAHEDESGITIHFVNEKFDEGEILHQSRFKIEPGDTLEVIKFKGQQLEHQHFPRVIEGLLRKMKS